MLFHASGERVCALWKSLLSNVVLNPPFFSFLRADAPTLGTAYFMEEVYQ